MPKLRDNLKRAVLKEAEPIVEVREEQADPVPPERE